MFCEIVPLISREKTERHELQKNFVELEISDHTNPVKKCQTIQKQILQIHSIAQNIAMMQYDAMMKYHRPQKTSSTILTSKAP